MTAPSTRAANSHLSVHVQSVPKRDRQQHENEDSAAGNLAEGRFAVSDGASTSARSDVWSRLLADAFASGRDPLAPQTLAELRQEWWSLVFSADLAWYAQAKLDQGSAATFVGLHLLEDSYRVMAVGDSCVFHIRGDKVILAAPIERWQQFSRFPALVSTRAEGQPITDSLWEGGGTFMPGDIFVLATDAVAKHLLRECEERGQLLPISKHAQDSARFIEFVDTERNRGLDNDDATVCVVTT